MYFDPSPCITYLEKLLDNQSDDRAENGVVFDREAYLRDVEGFDDTEVLFFFHSVLVVKSFNLS